MSSAPIPRRWPWSLRTRIVVSTSAVIGVTLAAAFLWSIENLRVVLQNRNDAFLGHELSEFAGALQESIHDPRSPAPLEAFRHVARAAKEEGFYVLLQHDGKTEPLTPGDPTQNFRQALVKSDLFAVPRTIEVSGIAAGVRTSQAELTDGGGNRWTVILGLPLTDSHQTAASFNTRLATGGVLFLVVAVLGGFFLTRQAIQPVADSIAAARQLNPAELSARLPRTQSGDELDLLAATINDLLERVQHNHEQVVQFTADASHELRGPLAAIQAAIEVALQEPRSNSDYRDLLATLGEQCHRLTDLVNDLLLLAKADAGQIDLQRAAVDLNDLVSEVVETYQPLADDQKVTLAWDGSNPVVCRGDRMRLLQLTMNLVDNAIKFTPEGGAVRLSLSASDATASLAVEDTGIGISADRLPRIFERFYQVDDSRSDGGTGLGLSICHWIAQAHGGTIDVSSQPGRGTQFRVSIPVTETAGPKSRNS